MIMTMGASAFAQYKPLNVSSDDFQEVNLKNSNSIRYSFLKMANNLINAYDSQENLAVEFIDASNPSVLNFYNSVTNRDNKEHMAMTYFKNFNIDGKNMATCFVFYEPSKKIFENYGTQGFNQHETFTYLVGHEMGHCFNRHKNIELVNSTDTRGSEVLADLFIIADRMNNNDYNLAVKIINFTKVSGSPIHQTSQFTEKFLLESNEKNTFQHKLSPDELLELTYKFFKNNYTKDVDKSEHKH